MNLQIQIEAEWSDDHLPCARVKIVKGNEARTFELWWTGAELLAALRHADESPRAFKVVKDLIDNVFNLEKEDDYICTNYGMLQNVKVLK